MRNFIDNNHCSYLSSGYQRNPNKIRSYEYVEQPIPVRNDRQYDQSLQSSSGKHLIPFVKSLASSARPRNYELQSNKQDYSYFSSSTVKETQAPIKRNDNNFLRQTYDGSSDNYFKQDLRAYNKETKSSKFLRSTVNGNLDDYIPKKPLLTGSYVGEYSANKAPQVNSTNPTNITSSLRQKYKIDEDLFQTRSDQRMHKHVDVETELDKNAQMMEELKKLKHQRKIRREYRNENVGIEELISLQRKKKSDSRQRKFTKKNYFQYYTPEFTKTAYEERFCQKNYTGYEKSKSRTPQKITRPQTPNLSKSPLKSTTVNPTQHSSPKIERAVSKYIQKQKTLKFSIFDFRLGKCLGEGKFGSVLIATHRSTSSIFAVKKIPKAMIKEHLMIDQFLKEVKLQSFMDHRNVLRIYGICDDTEHLYLILEYMQQGTLFRLLKTKKVLKQQEAAVYLRQVADAVRYIHQSGIAHRDIKPENIVMSNGICKLCDFGWATVCNERRKTYCGTFDYAAPEILEGIEYDMSVDLWCLGVLAYELMVGKAPFYHISRKETMKRILNFDSNTIHYPDSLSKNAISFIESLIKKDPDERMRSDSLLNHPFLKEVAEDSY